MNNTDKKVTHAEQTGQLNRSLEDGYYIGGRLETFKKTEIYPGKAKVYLPHSFIDLPELVREYNYPPSDQAQTIKANQDLNVTFHIKMLEHPEGMTVKKLANEFKFILGKAGASSKPSELKTERIETGLELAYFDIHNFGKDGDEFQSVCFAAHGSKMLQITFSCPECNYSDWKPAVKEVFRKLEIA